MSKLSITKRSTVVGAASLLIGVLVFAALVAVTPPTAAGTSERTGGQVGTLSKPQFNDDGSMARPATQYRQWVYVGTPLTPNELNPPEAPFPEFHSVYIHPDDFEHYSRTGKWADGTVFIKELVTVGSKQAVSGKGYFMGEFTGLEVMVRDRERFADEPGNWAYFSFGHEYPLAETANAMPTAACNACHAVNAADDFVFTQYYPVLRAAKPESRR